MSYLPCEVVNTGPEPDAAVIWLHGLGASGDDFVPIVPELRLPSDMQVRFIFPHAPSIPVTINGGLVMPAWYDIFELSFERKIDHEQILASSNAVEALIERELNRGVSSDRILLAGFSQGGAVVYHTALCYDKPLGGLITLSTYFATYETINPHPANRALPIHLFHGSYDDVVPEAMGRKAGERLEALGYKPHYKSYPIDHSVHHQEILDISEWLQTCLSKP